MSLNSSATKNQEQALKQEPKGDDKRSAAIQKMMNKQEDFSNDTKQIVSLSPNVAETMVFPSDFYLDYDDILNEQIQVNKKTPADAAEIAERDFRVKRSLEDDPDVAGRTYPQTTYRVTLPNSKFPNMVRLFKISSKVGIEEINKELERLAIKEGWTGPIIMRILKKQQGNNKFKVKWEVKADPFKET